MELSAFLAQIYPFLTMLEKQWCNGNGLSSYYTRYETAKQSENIYEAFTLPTESEDGESGGCRLFKKSNTDESLYLVVFVEHAY